MAQLYRHAAGLFVHAEIPVDVRTGDAAADKIAAYCHMMSEIAVPLLARADEAATQCAEHARKLDPGWWMSVCSPAP
jgi:hypothetical protein